MILDGPVSKGNAPRQATAASPFGRPGLVAAAVEMPAIAEVLAVVVIMTMVAIAAPVVVTIGEAFAMAGRAAPIVVVSSLGHGATRGHAQCQRGHGQALQLPARAMGRRAGVV